MADDDKKRPPKEERIQGRQRLRRLFGYIKPYKGRFAVALVALACGAALGLVPPAVIGSATDSAVLEQSLENIDKWTLILCGVFFAQAVFVFIRHFLMSWLGERMVADLRTDVYAHLMFMPVSYFRRNRTGELLSRLADDVTHLQSIIGQDISIALRNILSLVGTVGLLLWLHPFLTGVMLAIVPAFVIVTVLWGRVIRKISKQAQDELASASGDLQEAVGAIDIVQAFGRETYEVGRYRSAIARVFDLFVKRIWARSWFMSTTSLLAFLVLAGIFWLGGRMVANGEMTIGELFQFIMYTLGVAASLGSLSDMFGRYYQALGASARIFEILDTDPNIADPEHPESLDDPRGEIRFEQVSFSYEDEGELVIRDFDLEVAPGEVVALVGHSGSGKTTVSRLVLRAWDPQVGAVKLDGIDLRKLRLADLRGHMAVVSQEPTLFSGTVASNIRYGRLDASEADVVAAAEAANADAFIREFPDGYDTVIGERGVTLSGGQRQRIAIARALLRDPKVLILDEATSALDGESEHLVQQALERLQKGRTTLVIAHRLSTIRDADRILVLDHGRIVEQGDHAALLAKGGAYARLVAHQTRDEAAANPGPTSPAGAAASSAPGPDSDPFAQPA